MEIDATSEFNLHLLLRKHTNVTVKRYRSCVIGIDLEILFAIKQAGIDYLNPGFIPFDALWKIISVYAHIRLNETGKKRLLDRLFFLKQHKLVEYKKPRFDDPGEIRLTKLGEGVIFYLHDRIYKILEPYTKVTI